MNLVKQAMDKEKYCTFLLSSDLNIEVTHFLGFTYDYRRSLRNPNSNPTCLNDTMEDLHFLLRTSRTMNTKDIRKI